MLFCVFSLLHSCLHSDSYKKRASRRTVTKEGQMGRDAAEDAPETEKNKVTFGVSDDENEEEEDEERVRMFPRNYSTVVL